jgi:hypothetical protein
MKEATQNYDKPFGGVALIMVGDFDQQPHLISRPVMRG